MPPASSQHRKWSAAGVVATVGSLAATLAVIGAFWWAAAGVAYSAQRIPALEQQQEINTRDIAVLKQAQQYNDARYGEILTQLRSINDKLDRKQDRRTP